MPPVKLPQIGLGTYQYQTSEACVQSVKQALELGYRHIDTAQKYGSEAEVGEAIAQSSVPREEIFLATKIAESNLAREDVIETAAASLDRLGVEQVDALYVHWPAITYDATETLEAFNDLLADGVMRYVGLGNFSPDLIDEAHDVLDEPPLAVQVEMHPRCQQRELLRYVREHDMYLVAYCPLMRGGVFDDPELTAIASDAGLSAAELSLAWLASKPNVIPIPKATGEEHLRQNLDAAQIELGEEVIDRLDAIERTNRVVDPPEKGPWNW